MKLNLSLSLAVERRETLGDWISLTLTQSVSGDTGIISVGNTSLHLDIDQLKALGTALLTAADAYHANPVGSNVFIHALRLGESETTLSVDGDDVNPNINIFTTLTK